VLKRRKKFGSRKERAVEIKQRLQEVGILDPNVADRFPFQLSGGMCQRVGLAAALAGDPDLLIADEPSTALDVTTQAEILKLLRRTQKERGMSLVLITHDLRLAFSTCDRVYVLYAGSILEIGGAQDIEREPFHPYTLGLLMSEPPVEKRLSKMMAIRGSVPTADEVVGSCKFVPRCEWAQDACCSTDPKMADLATGHSTTCIRFSEIRKEMRSVWMQAVAGDDSSIQKPTTDNLPLVQIKSLTKTFGKSKKRQVTALKNVELEILPGESVGLVGESGSGKTTLGRCLVGLESPSSGEVMINGINASDFGVLGREDLSNLRKTIQIVFQDPYSTLNPKHTVRRCLLEAMRAASSTKSDPTDADVFELLNQVELPSDYALRRPAQLSGGERQRVAIARSLAVDPRILVCDEPVSALDVSVQAQILNLFKRLQTLKGISLLFITHDLAVLRQIVDRVYVLYRGEIVEQGIAEHVLSRPQHSYTRRLISSIPHSTI
jgi:peptide/nickel transport system ATP-binding protein